MSSESEDFWRKISDGLTLRSNELDCDWEVVFESVSMVLVVVMEDERDGERCWLLEAPIGTVGGSTGAARRMFFGGGLKHLFTEKNKT